MRTERVSIKWQATFGALRSTGTRIPVARLAVTFYLLRPRYKSRLELPMSLRRYSVARILQNPCCAFAMLIYNRHIFFVVIFNAIIIYFANIEFGICPIVQTVFKIVKVVLTRNFKVNSSKQKRINRV